MVKRLCIAFLLAAVANLSHATGPIVSALDMSMCNLSEPGDSGWYERETYKDGSVRVDCIISLPDESRGHSQTMKIDGRIVTLKKVRSPKISSKLIKPWQDVVAYVAEDGKIQVKLYSRLFHDSCLEVTEACCGQEYLGKLQVTTARGKATVKVWRSTGS